MNTRQKLTLGIAAIFMVTLTIVGVTYAYFVTRVTGDVDTETVNVTTATIGEVRYDDEGSSVVQFTDVLPGVTKYKVFSVVNDSDDANSVGVYNVVLENTSVEGVAQFIHDAEDSADCYKSGVYPSNSVDNTETEASEAPTSACFDGSAYNNISVTLYKVTNDGGYTSVVTEGNNEITAEQFGTLTTQSVVTQDLSISLNNLATSVELGGTKTDYYVLAVTYENRNANQNLENEAQVNIKVNIN